MNTNTKDKIIRCSKCNKEIDKAGYCASCRAKYNKQYKQAHRDEIQAYHKQYNKQYWQDTFHHGVYIFAQDDDVKYIGSSSHLEARIKSHLNGHSQLADKLDNEAWNSIWYFETDGFEDKADDCCRWLESYLINQFPLHMLWNNANEQGALFYKYLGMEIEDTLMELVEDESNWICYKHIDR